MSAYFVRRALYTFMSVLGVLIMIFFVQRLTGDPATLFASETATAEEIELLRARMGLDKPLWVQFVTFLRGALTGDFGNSYGFGERALPLVLERMPATIQLAATSMTIAIVVGVLLGVTSGTKPGSVWDSLCTIVATLGRCMPTFWSGLMLILIFSVTLRVLPTSGKVGPRSLVLPAVTLALYSTASIARLLRSAILDTLSEDYVRTARAKGLGEAAIIYRHVLKNAAIPVVTIIALQAGRLLSGAVITETVFAWPGAGRLMIQGVYKRDFPLVQAIVFVFALIFGTANFVADIAYRYLDPRIRYE